MAAKASRSKPQSRQTFTSNPGTTNSERERSGVSRMPSRRRSRDSIRFHNSRLRQNSVSFWRLGSRKLSKDSWRYRPDRRFFVTPFCLAGVARRPAFPRPADFPEARLIVSLRIADDSEVDGDEPVYRELPWESEFASMSDLPCSRQRTTKIHLAEIGW